MDDVWFAPDDPSLPMPWKGIVDGNTCLYYWNPETNITQYEKPAWVSSPSLSASCSPGPFYPPHPTVSDFNLHSQYSNLYPHYEAPAETIINGYTFPIQFPFPNHTHTPTNQPINPQSQSTDYHYHSLTHPPISHPSYPLPPFATSAYPSESDYGYLSPLPNPSDQPFSCISYSTSPHNPSYSPITYPHTAPKELIVPPYQLPYTADLIPPSALAYTTGVTCCTEKDNVPPLEMKKSLCRNLKMRSHVMMKRKPRSQFPRRRRTQNNGGSEGDLCKASSLVAVNWDSTILFDKSVNSLSELTVLDLVVKSGSTSVSSKDAPLSFPGEKKKPFLSAEAVYGQMLGPDEFCNSGRAKDLLRLADFQRIKGNNGGPLVDWELKSNNMVLARFYFNLSLEKTIMNSGHILAEVEQNAIVIHFCNLVIVNHFSLVTNFLSGLNPILLSMNLVESPVILEVSIRESYEHGSKHEAGEFDKFMVCSFTVQLIKTLRVAHLQATLSDWKVREKIVVSGSTGGFEYDLHLENLTRNSQQLCVNMNCKGCDNNCSVMYHWLPSLNWNEAFLFGQDINFQQDFLYLGKGIVRLNYNLCFSAEICFLGLITSIVHLGLATIMHTSSHAWDLQFHKLQTSWIIVVNAYTATLSYGLNKGSLVVVLGIRSGTIDLPSLGILNGHSEVMVISCHLLGGKSSYHVWLNFLTNKDQGVMVILIAIEKLVQCLSFMFDLNSQNVIVIFILNQPLIVQQLFSLSFDTAVIFLLILFAKLILIICGMTHNNLDGAALPNALWSAQICEDIVQWQLHSTMIIAFLLDMVSTRTMSDTNAFRYYSGSHSSLANLNMKLQVCLILYDLGLQKHGHELNYFFMACVVLALFLLVVSMLIKDVNGGHLYRMEVVVEIHEVLFCQLRRFFVQIIDYLQGNSEFFPMSYSSGPIVLLPTIDIQSLMHIMFQVGLLMTHEPIGVDKRTLLIPPLFALGVRWFLVQCFLNQLLALLFANTLTVFESLNANSITKLVTSKYKKATLDVNFPAAIFYVASLFFSLLQLIEKFQPNQLVESPRYCMSKQEILATFWICLPTALSSLGDWVFILHGLIGVWVHVLISNTILLGELKVDHESHITPTGTMATGLVFPFVENSRGDFFQYGCSTHKDTKMTLSECLTFCGGALSLKTAGMICICVNQLTLKSTAQTLWLDATARNPLIVNPTDVVVQFGILIIPTFKFIFTLVMGNKIVGVDGMIEEVRGKVTIHDAIPFILLPNGSCGCWNAKNAKAKDFHAQMWGEGIQSTMNLPTEDPSTGRSEKYYLDAIERQLAQLPTYYNFKA